MRHYEAPICTLSRSSSSQSTTQLLRSTSSSLNLDLDSPVIFHHQSIVPHASPAFRRLRNGVAAFLRSLFAFQCSIQLLPTCAWLAASSNQLSITPALGEKVTGTLFGNRRGAVSFAVQYDPRSEPVFLIEFAVSTAALVKKMSSGLVRIALECEKAAPVTSHGGGGGRKGVKLFREPTWTMYCNGRRCGIAQTRECNESDWHVLSAVRSVSVGAGVIPAMEGEVMYMRARFERVVGNRDSEAFHMLNPDGGGGPEFGIFLLRNI